MAYIVGRLDTVALGKRGENLARRVMINIHDWVMMWPGARYEVLVRRPTESDLYIANTEVSGDMLVWPVTAADTGIAGDGYGEVRALQGDVVVKSSTFRTVIAPALDGTEGSPPSPGADWVNEVMDAAERAEDAAKNAKASVQEGLAEAKESGEFKGDTGRRGAGFYPTKATFESGQFEYGGVTYSYRFKISEVKADTGEDVYPGDILILSNMLFHIRGTSSTYAFAIYLGYLKGDKGDSVTIKQVEESAEDGGENVVFFSDGTRMSIMNGRKGSQGVGIASIEQTAVSSSDNGDNVWAATLTNGDRATFTVKNGSKGSPGKDGTSISIANITESTEDGGVNEVLFSDGKALKVRNGSKGDDNVFIVHVNGSIADATAQEIYDAAAAGKACFLAWEEGGYLFSYEGGAVNPSTNAYEPRFVSPLEVWSGGGSKYGYNVAYVSATGTVDARSSPVKTPTPYKLKLAGAVSAEFDGTEEVTVNIPEGVDGGSGILMVNFSTEDGETWTADKTNAEMYEASSRGQMLYASFDGTKLPILSCTGTFALFGVAISMGGETGFLTLTVENDTATATVSPITAESDVMVVHPVAPITDGTGIKFTVDHTSDEIREAVESGKTVVFQMNATFTLKNHYSDSCVFERFDAETGYGTRIGTRTTVTVEGNVARVEESYIAPKLQPLTINGVSYDGITAVEVETPIASDGGVILTDTETDKQYRLCIINGKLTMEEVAE